MLLQSNLSGGKMYRSQFRFIEPSQTNNLKSHCIHHHCHWCVQSLNYNSWFSGLYFVISVGYSIFFSESMPNVAVTITIFIFNLQAVISTIFLVQWQKRGSIHKFIHLLKEPQNGEGVNKYRKGLLGQMMAALSMSILILLYITSTFGVYFSGKNVTVIDREIINSFGNRDSYIIPLIAQEYALFGWNLSILIYVFCVEVTFYEIRYFNRSIKTISGLSEESLCSEVSNAIKKYSDIAVAVRSLNKILKRYAFMMIACSIPSLLFCLYIVFSRLNSEMEEKVIMIPALLYLLYSFFSLTAVPAKLHDEITKTKSAFYENTQIWFPYRSSVYNAAVAFCSHLEQSNLGISIWGFALLSRPIILTTLSVMATCLALLLQFRGYKFGGNQMCNCSTI